MRPATAVPALAVPALAVPALALAAQLVLAAPLRAETPMTGAEFEANTTGETITFDYGGGLFGTEEFLPGRKVRWAFEGDQCLDGIWYEKGDQICFVYEDEPTPACWHYFLEGGKIRGVFMGEGGGWEILESARDGGPLPCPGPDVGV